jgi:HD-like signal output (HDOD) protein
MTKTCRTCNRVYDSDASYLSETSQWRICSAKNLWFNCRCGSTLMIPQGKFSWYDPGHRLSTPAKSIFNTLSGFEAIPRIPTTVMELQIKIKDPNVEISEITKLLRTDPILSGEILGLANRLKSARIEDTSKIQSIEHAINYIGRKDVGQYILALSIRSFKINTKVFNAENFWKDSFLRGSVAELLAQKLNVPDIIHDEVFLAATLCNLGKFVGAMIQPEDIDRVSLQLTKPSSENTWSSVELSFPHINHLHLGEIAAAIWGLPDYIMNATRFHHRFPEPNAKLRDRQFMPELVSLANSVTHWILGEPSRIDRHQFQAILKGFSLTEQSVETIIANIVKTLHSPT